MTLKTDKNQPHDAPQNGDSLRQTVKKMAEQIEQIHTCLFGNAADPTRGLFLQVDRNTRFRTGVSRLLFVLIPGLIAGVWYLITQM